MFKVPCWFNGRILAFQASDPGSIPGQGNSVSNVVSPCI